MHVLVAADLHFNHLKSRESAEEIIDQINASNADVLLMLGDAGVADGDSIEQCLSRISFAGPKLFVPGNHELWSRTADAWDLLERVLPERIAALGWQWLPASPFVSGDVAIVGSIGWYDYTFAEPSLEIDRAFYEAKASPGAVIATEEPAALLGAAKASSERAREIVARWNDRRFVRLPISDDTLVTHECERLTRQLIEVNSARSVLVATHTVPFRELLPIRRGRQWDFVRAYLGSERLGETIQSFGNISSVVCGHSHWPVEETIGAIRAVNVGAGYRHKQTVSIEL